MHKSVPEQSITLAINIHKITTEDDLTYYQITNQYSDDKQVSPASWYSVTSSDVLLNVINLSESTFCKRVLIVVDNDENLRENLKVLSGQSTSKSKVSVLNQIAYNANEKAKLSSLFRVVNIEIL